MGSSLSELDTVVVADDEQHEVVELAARDEIPVCPLPTVLTIRKTEGPTG